MAKAMKYISGAEILQHALSIAEEYRNDGLTLSLRQIYYRFVALGLLPSSQNVYKRIGEVLTDARYTGEFPVDWIQDRGRDLSRGRYTRCDTAYSSTVRKGAMAQIRAIPNILLDADTWYGQETFVSVWVEKEALAGIFESVCGPLGVSWFACKGYPSVSMLWEWCKTAAQACGRNEFTMRMNWTAFETQERHEGLAERCVVLYFGDHDPDGWEIPRSAERGLRRLMQLDDADREVEFEFKRIALNMDQIRQYDPPPFWAKESSARFKGYVDEHDTRDAWELDALEPRVLQQLIRQEVEPYFDSEVFEQNREAIKDARALLRDQMCREGFVSEALDAMAVDDDIEPPDFGP